MVENQIIVYQPNETVRLDVWLANETVWLNQSRIGELFGVDRTVVNRHIHNIYKTGELDEPSTCAKIAQVQKEGGRSITRQLGRCIAERSWLEVFRVHKTGLCRNPATESKGVIDISKQ